jgi:hypothetical protein
MDVPIGSLVSICYQQAGSYYLRYNNVIVARGFDTSRAARDYAIEKGWEVE